MDPNIGTSASPVRKRRAPMQAGSARLGDPNFSPMVRRAVIVGVIGWVVKIATMIKVNNDLGGQMEIRTWGPGVPYLAFEINRPGFMHITSSSTRVMAMVMVVLLVAGLLRNKSKVHVAGWCFAPVSLASTLGVDYVLHRWIGEYTDPQQLRLAVWLLALCCVLVAWWIAAEHPHERLTHLRNEAADELERGNVEHVSYAE